MITKDNVAPLPLISIIIPTLNCANNIKESLLSILNQKNSSFEIVVMDGLSTDGTLDIANELSKYHDNIVIFSEPDNGIYHAMNKGITRARGDWLYFMGGDDILFDELVLQDISASMRSNKTTKVIYGNVIFMSTNEKYRGKFNGIILTKYNICHQAIFYNRSIFDEIGYYNTSYITLADYHFNIKWFYNKKIQRIYLDRIIAKYNDRGSAYFVRDEKFIKEKQSILFENLPAHLKVLYKLRETFPIRNYWNGKLLQVKFR